MSDPQLQSIGIRECTKRINRIKSIVCAYYGVTPSMVDSRAKPQEVAEARQVSIWISHKLCNGMYHIIAKLFGRTRGSVKYTVKTINNRIEVVKGFRDLVDMLTSKCQ